MRINQLIMIDIYQLTTATRLPFYSHEIVERLGAIKTHDVDALKLLVNFSVRMLQRCGRHAAVDCNSHLTVLVFNEDRSVQREEDTETINLC